MFKKKLLLFLFRHHTTKTHCYASILKFKKIQVPPHILVLPLTSRICFENLSDVQNLIPTLLCHETEDYGLSIKYFKCIHSILCANDMAKKDRHEKIPKSGKMEGYQGTPPKSLNKAIFVVSKHVLYCFLMFVSVLNLFICSKQTYFVFVST